MSRPPCCTRAALERARTAEVETSMQALSAKHEGLQEHYPRAAPIRSVRPKRRIGRRRPLRSTGMLPMGSSIGLDHTMV